MNWFGNSLESEKKYNVSVIILGVFFIFSVGFTLYNNGHGFSHVLFCNPNDSFMDFFGPVGFSYNRNPYSDGSSIYPAICYLFFFIISKFIPVDIATNGGKAIRSSQVGLVMYAVYMLLLIWAIIALLKRMCKYRHKTLFAFLFVFSNPFVHELERGNIILLALVLSGHFLIYKDSDNKWLREWALLALALAASIKIYPAAFAILLLKDKKWLEIVKIALYGAAFSIIPFFFMGGFDKIWVFIKALDGNKSVSGVGQGPGFKVNYSNAIVEVVGFFRGFIDETMYSVAIKLAYVVDLLVLIAAIMNKKKWQTLTLISCLIVGAPAFSYHYAMLFMIFAMVSYLNDEDFNRLDWLFILLFTAQFGLVMFGGIRRLHDISGGYPISIGVFIEGISVLIMSVVLSLLTFYDCLRFKNIKENSL